MVRSHSGPDPCYYRAADLGTKWSHCFRCCRGWCRSNEDKAMCHTPTYNYKLHACVQLHTQTEARSHQRSHTAFADSQTDTSWHRSSTRTFIFMLHCIEFNTQNLVLGLGNRDRKVIQKRGLCVISLCHSSRARTHAHTQRHQCCLRKVQWVSLVMLTHPSVKRRPNICSAWLQLLCTPASLGQGIIGKIY